MAPGALDIERADAAYSGRDNAELVIGIGWLMREDWITEGPSPCLSLGD